eukprot:TRINITY_DN2487_c0_g1_i1.p1 TRINITY_DN2487_c0_g1~~TRINITY_DN2487_c0_g1_i1.p1  ORF type:complete len:370 (+),score=49.53 TRINITY_DN2487_c0_g1_i1:54-1163(+)
MAGPARCLQLLCFILAVEVSFAFLPADLEGIPLLAERINIHYPVKKVGTIYKKSTCRPLLEKDLPRFNAFPWLQETLRAYLRLPAYPFCGNTACLYLQPHCEVQLSNVSAHSYAVDAWIGEIPEYHIPVSAQTTNPVDAHFAPPTLTSGLVDHGTTCVLLSARTANALQRAKKTNVKRVFDSSGAMWFQSEVTFVVPNHTQFSIAVLAAAGQTTTIFGLPFLQRLQFHMIAPTTLSFGPHTVPSSLAECIALSYTDDFLQVPVVIHGQTMTLAFDSGSDVVGLLATDAWQQESDEVLSINNNGELTSNIPAVLCTVQVGSISFPATCAFFRKDGPRLLGREVLQVMNLVNNFHDVYLCPRLVSMEKDEL